MIRTSLVALVVLVACGGGTDDPAPADTAAANDAPAQVATVMTVPCDGTELPAPIETTGGFRFNPSTMTISKDQVIKFVSGSTHNVVPDTAPTDTGLSIPAVGATGCLKFTATGSFKFKCQPHPSMKGTITVN